MLSIEQALREAFQLRADEWSASVHD